MNERNDKSRSSHVHTCMSCGEQWECPIPEYCVAGDKVLPSIVLKGPRAAQTFDHVCQRKRAASAEPPIEPPQDWQEIFEDYRHNLRSNAWLYQQIEAHSQRARRAASHGPEIDVRGEICSIVSRMLDNPDQSGIYPTTRCYDELEALCGRIASARSDIKGDGNG